MASTAPVFVCGAPVTAAEGGGAAPRTRRRRELGRHFTWGVDTGRSEAGSTLRAGGRSVSVRCWQATCCKEESRMNALQEATAHYQPKWGRLSAPVDPEETRI